MDLGDEPAEHPRAAARANARLCMGDAGGHGVLAGLVMAAKLEVLALAGFDRPKPDLVTSYAGFARNQPSTPLVEEFVRVLAVEL